MFKQKLVFFTIFLVATSFLTDTSHSKVYDQVVNEESKIEFSGVQNRKTEFTGHFKQFEVSADFNAEDLGASHINVTIDLASAESGSSKRDSKLKMGNWFDIDNTPRSYFKSSSIKAISEGLYQIDGQLEIKGITKPYSFKLQIRELVDLLKLSGNFTINRLDFDLGLGAWKNPDWVNHEADVEFDITVKNQKE